MVLRAAPKERGRERVIAIPVPAILIAIVSIKGLIQSGARLKSGGNISPTIPIKSGTPSDNRCPSNNPTVPKLTKITPNNVNILVKEICQLLCCRRSKLSNLLVVIVMSIKEDFQVKFTNFSEV